ncbi:MAG: hypothetical protein AB7S74_13665 [Hyphomicrobium sp.]
MVEFDFLAPSGFGVTARTTLPQLPFVGVALFVTGNALDRQLLFEKVARVALVAFDFLMSAFEWKLGPLMIETHRRPLRRAVAAFALFAISALVHVVDAVTGNARSRQILVTFAYVASRTFDVLVRAFQWKMRLCVIERFLLCPALFIMASGALVP